MDNICEKMLSKGHDFQNFLLLSCPEQKEFWNVGYAYKYIQKCNEILFYRKSQTYTPYTIPLRRFNWQSNVEPLCATCHSDAWVCFCRLVSVLSISFSTVLSSAFELRPSYQNKLNLISLPSLSSRKKMRNSIFIFKLLNSRICSLHLLSSLSYTYPSTFELVKSPFSTIKREERPK